jgi:predicted secreted protein
MWRRRRTGRAVTWFEAFIVFLLTWWLTLFCVLPWGVRRSEAPEAGHEPGAPERPRLWRKALVTTAIALVLTLVVFLIVDSGLISFREMTGRAPY